MHDVSLKKKLEQKYLLKSQAYQQRAALLHMIFKLQQKKTHVSFCSQTRGSHGCKSHEKHSFTFQPCRK
eukprot:11152990-Ditylum_brightwellii.AAC.1